MTYNVRDKRYGLTEEEIEAELRCFQKHFPDKRLLAIQLDGFSHNVVYDDIPKTPKAHSVSASFCCSEEEWLGYCNTEEERAKAKAARAFLKEIGYDSHACYQGRAVEIVYVEPNER